MREIRTASEPKKARKTKRVPLPTVPLTAKNPAVKTTSGGRGMRFNPKVRLDPSQVTDKRNLSMEGRPLPSGKAWPSRYSDVYQMQDYMRGHSGAAQILLPSGKRKPYDDPSNPRRPAAKKSRYATKRHADIALRALGKV